MKAKVTVVHAPNIEVCINTQVSFYAPSKAIYFLTDGDDEIYLLRSLYRAEKERSDWIRKYQNALNGLYYWKSKVEELQKE